jgi:hypothetical protein
MTDKKEISEANSLGLMTAFKNEPPLHTAFPVTLSNGKMVPSIHVVCSKCDAQISGDRIHGRVVQSLPHVLTISANGYCDECDRLTHIQCRFRTNDRETLVEWLGSNGYWQARKLRQPTLVEKIARGARRLAAWFAKAL